MDTPTSPASPAPDETRPPVPGRPGTKSSLARNVLSNWTAMALSIASAFIVTPMVVRALDKELYGVWSFLNGLLVYSDLLYFGLGAALIRNVALLRARGDQASLNRIASVVVTIYLGLGTICLVAFASLGLVVTHLFAAPLSPEAASAASWACVLLGVQLFSSFVGSGFAGVLYGSDRVDLTNFVRIVSIIGRASVIIAFVDGPRPLNTLAIITAIATALEAAGTAALAFWLDPGLRIRPVLPIRAELKHLYSFGVQSFVIIVATTLIAYTDTTVIGVAIGAAWVGVYSLPLQLMEYIRSTISSVSGVLFPRLTVMAQQGDTAAVRHAYVKGTRFILFLATFMTANMMVLGSPFLTVWVGGDFGSQVVGVVVCLALATQLHLFAVVIPHGFYLALDILGTPARVLIVEAIANLVLSLALAPRFGILGVAMGTLIPAAVVSCFVLPPYLWRKLGVHADDVRRMVIPSLILLAAVGATQWALGFALGGGSYLALAVRVACTAPLVGIVFATTFPAEDRAWALAGLRSVVPGANR